MALFHPFLDLAYYFIYCQRYILSIFVIDIVWKIKLANYFHDKLREICEKYEKGSYLKYKNWCDEYFFLPHRNEPRGLGGIFYDYLDSKNWESDFSFTKDVGQTFLNAYISITKKTMNLKWNESDKDLQLHRRSRYAEFN